VLSGDSCGRILCGDTPFSDSGILSAIDDVVPCEVPKATFLKLNPSPALHPT